MKGSRVLNALLAAALAAVAAKPEFVTSSYGWRGKNE